MALIDNLISYFKLDEASGNAVDSVGGHTGTNTSVTYGAGKINNGASFNGSSSFLDAGNITDFYGLTAMSINLWVKKNVGTTLGSFVYKWDYNTQGTFGVGVDGSNGSELQMFVCNAINDAGSNQVATTTAGMTTGVWYMATFVYDGSQANANRVKIYLNGSLLSGNVVVGTIPTALTSGSASLKIGKFGGSLGRYFNGSLDEIGIWSRVLSEAEITQLYNSGAGLQYPFSGGGGSFTISVSDSFSLSESRTTLRARLLSLADTFSLSESVTRLRARLLSVSDSFSLDDTIFAAKAILLSVIDTFSLSDTRAMLRGLKAIVTDTISQTNIVTALRARTLAVTDSFGLSEAFTSLTHRIAQVADSIGLTESISMVRSFIARVADFFGLSDVLTARMVTDTNYLRVSIELTDDYRPTIELIEYKLNIELKGGSQNVNL